MKVQILFEQNLLAKKICFWPNPLASSKEKLEVTGNSVKCFLEVQFENKATKFCLIHADKAFL